MFRGPPQWKDPKFEDSQFRKQFHLARLELPKVN